MSTYEIIMYNLIVLVIGITGSYHQTKNKVELTPINLFLFLTIAFCSTLLGYLLGIRPLE